MFKSPAFRNALRAASSRQVVAKSAANQLPRLAQRAAATPHIRSITTTPVLRDPTDKEYDAATTSAAPGESGDHEGQFARPDPNITFKHPEEEHYPSSQPVQGRGGNHNLRTLPTFSMEGKTAIITGGARGLGLVMSQALYVSGADIAIVDLNKEEANSQAKQLMETYKSENPGESNIPKISTHFCDVSSPTSVKQTFQEVLKQHGKVDTLVTSAGFTENYTAVSYPPDRMQKLWGVNVDGTYFFCVEVAKHLMEREEKGSIVCIGSMSGSIVNVPQPQAPYNAAKAAVRHLVSSLAVEWAHAGIRVNCISPGYMLTALTKKILDENPDLSRQWTSLIPVGKMGRPEDLMGAVVFLASEASSYVTGADLRVDGGYTCT